MRKRHRITENIKKNRKRKVRNEKRTRGKDPNSRMSL